MNPFSPGIGDTVGIRDTDRRCVVVGFYPGSLVGVRDCGTRGEAERLHIRPITPPPPAKEDTAAPSAESATGIAHPELSRIEDKDWEKAKLRYAIIKPLLDAHHPSASVVEQRAKEYGFARSRLYAWMRAYRNGGQTLSTLLDGKPSVRKGTRLLDPRIEELLGKIIETHYMTKQRLRVGKIDLLLEARCKEEGIPKVGSEEAPRILKPHVNTIRNRINALSPRRRMESREGRDKASKYMARGEGFVADFPMQYVQIDHTLVNVILRDEKTRVHLRTALDHGRHRHVQPHDRRLLHFIRGSGRNWHRAVRQSPDFAQGRMAARPRGGVRGKAAGLALLRSAR